MKRGFSTMTPERQREIASAGGRAVRAESRSFSQDRELASKAGAKGGRAVADENRSFSKDAALASRAGAKGGAATQRKRREAL
jgi:general stress protein YciG